MAVLTLTGKLPLGSEAAWFWPPPQPESARASPTPATIPQVLILQALNAGGTYHQGRRPKPGLPAVAVAASIHRGSVPCWDPPPFWVGLCQPERWAGADPWEDADPLIRAVADRAFLPTKSVLEEVGNMMILTGRTLVSAVRPPYPYGSEFVGQFLFAMRLCWFPLLISTIAFGYEAPGLQAANFLVLFGALDRLGGFFVLASIREFAPFVDAIVLAGVAGTAITADLGARKIREELDALQVLGVDPIKNLVVPRFLALMLVTGLFDIYALIFGVFGGILATVVNHAPLGPFFATFFNNAETTDLWGSVVKTTLFGAIIAIVCCYKGMTASGGAEGVGRAVNQAVVIAFLGVFAFNYAFTQTLLATHPEITTIIK